MEKVQKIFTYKEVAEIFNINHNRVSQIEFKAIVARLKTNKLTLEKDTFLSEEEKKLLDKKM